MKNRILVLLFIFAIFSVDGHADHTIRDPQILDLIEQLKIATKRYNWKKVKELEVELRAAMDRNDTAAVQHLQAELTVTSQLKEKLRRLRENTFGEVGVIVESNDGAYFFLKDNVAQESETLTNLIEDAGTDSPITLDHINEKTLGLLKWILTHFPGKTDQEKTAFSTDAATPEHKTVIRDLILAANYLGIKPLLEGAAAVYATIILGSDVPKIQSWSPVEYANYKKAFLDPIPLDIQRFILERNVLKIPPILVLEGATNYPVAFSPNNRFIATRCWEGVKLWSNSPSKDPWPLQNFHSGRIPISGAFSCDSAFFALKGHDDTTMLWPIEPVFFKRETVETQEEEIDRCWINVRDFALSPTDNILAILSEAGEIGLWRTDPHRPAQIIPALLGLHERAHRIAFSPDGKKLATYSLGPGSLIIWTIEADYTLKLRATKSVSFWFLRFCPDSKTLLLTGRNGTELWSLSDDNLERIATFGEKFRRFCAMTSDGEIIVRLERGNMFSLWRNLPGEHTEPLGFVSCQSEPTDLVFSPDSRRMAIAMKDRVEVRLVVDNTRINLAEAQVLFAAASEKVKSRDEMPPWLLNVLSPYADALLFDAAVKKAS